MKGAGGREGSVAPSSCLVGDTKRDEGSREKGMARGPARTLGRGVRNGEDARDVPFASVTTEIAETELGTNIGIDPTERTGFEQDARIEGSTRRLDEEGVGTVEATERSKVTPDWKGGTTERSQVIRNANRGATIRSETVLKPKDECKEGEEAERQSRSILGSIGMVGPSKVETEVLEVENDEESTKGTASTSCYDRLFTDEELDMLERGKDQVVKDEPEEYEKELEERLFPLDDKEVMLCVQRNTEEQEKPTLAEMSAMLGMSEEVLERTRDISSGVLGTPEHWLNWYTGTLETSTEAKRANRNFREMEGSDVRSQPAVSSVLATEGERVGSEGSAEDAVEREFVRNVCVGLDGTAVSSSKSPEEVVGTVLFRWRSIIRSRVYELLKQGQNAKESRLPEDPEGLERVDAEGTPPLRDKVEEYSLDEKSLRDYLVDVGGTLSGAFINRAISWARCYHGNKAAVIRDKLLARERGAPEKVGPVVATGATNLRKKVTFDLPMKTLDNGELRIANEAPEVYSVNARRAPEPWRRPGLHEVSGGDATENKEGVVPESKRVIYSVGGVLALSDGFIDCCPSEMLAYTGAIASLVDKRVLKRLGRPSEPLRPYMGSLNSVSGHAIRISGVIDLPVTLGTLERALPFVVTDHLFVDAILGTDSLRAFRAVIDLEKQNMTLKGTGEALVRSGIHGTVRNHAVELVEGVPGSDELLTIARTLCTVTDGTVLVEVCNASTEEIEIKAGAYAAAVTIVPKSAFTTNVPRRDGTSRDISAVLSAINVNASAKAGTVEAEMAGAMDSAGEDDFEVDFQDSSLGAELRRLFAEMLKGMKDLFVETSKKPGRTELLKFSIDTGTHLPIKQPPYRVSKAEGDVMGSETQEYLDLGLIGPSTSPWGQSCVDDTEA
ncbi:hypothetical protein PC117_g21988 [Phytophthora cactorum]|uniref:Uncharacterized protein n=1 Tax=Phytophthora cactorum TaxID=29920 RepID=A0A8T1BBR8_9STRA|nr:hypothetical protein PC117_g21988 [Phytophthora cactorum]